MYVPAALDEIEKRYLRDLWRTPSLDVVMELRIDLVRFGPVQASIVCQESEEPLVNVILGAGVKNAVKSGHLADAVDWARSHGVDYRVPVTPGLPHAERAERWLMEQEHEQSRAWTKFVRDTAPAIDDSPGIEVELIDCEDWCESFARLVNGVFGDSRWLSSFCIDLFRRPDWRLYAAYEEGGEGESLAAAAMLMHEGMAHLGLLASEGANGGECQAALIHRGIRDAAGAGCRTIFAETEAPAPGERLSETAENLYLAGFEQAFVRTDWRPSRSSVRPAVSAWDSTTWNRPD